MTIAKPKATPKATSKAKSKDKSPLVTPAALAVERRAGVAYWIVKIEQDVYPWSQFIADKRAVWDGVRNYTARNNLRAMKLGDVALYYHSGEGKALVGISKVSREAFADPTANEGEDWSAVELVPYCALHKSVTLDQLRSNTLLGAIMLVRQPRLSVSSMTPAQFDEVLRLSGTTLAAVS